MVDFYWGAPFCKKNVFAYKLNEAKLYTFRKCFACSLLDFFGPNGTRCARCQSWAQKCLDFKGPPFPMALEMDVPAWTLVQVPVPVRPRYLAVLACVGGFEPCLYTVMLLSGIPVSLLHECKWARGQLLFNANEIESAYCDAENC